MTPVPPGAVVGVVGLGNMGSALAANLVQAGGEVSTYDLAGPERSPEGASFVSDIGELAARADILVLSLPDGAASKQVAAAIAQAPLRAVSTVLDTSTIGPDAAGSVEATLRSAGINYLDSPVSGGVTGARNRTLMVMYAGSDETCTAAEPVLHMLSDRRRRVGDRPGMAQALKLANNFLSAVSLTATSEAMWFLQRSGLDLSTALEVLNISSGQSAATSDKFPRQVVTGAYSAGFANNLMAKDVALYLSEVQARDGAADFARLTQTIWSAFAAANPGADFTRIHEYVGTVQVEP